MKRVHIVIHGDVIGVGFRAWSLTEAQKLNLAGWVRNGDHLVEIVAEGTQEHLDKFVAECRRGPELAAIKSVDIRWEAATNKFVSFDVLY